MSRFNFFKRKEDVSNTLYIITVVYNPMNFESRYRLYHEFKSYIGSHSNAKLLTVEVALGDREFKVTHKHNKWNLQLRSPDVMWHKEAAVNAGFNYLMNIVPHAKYIGWFDCDIKFSNVNWVKDTIHALNKYDIVQPYSEAINMNVKNEYMWHTPSALKFYHDRLGYHQYPPVPSKYLCGGHPGLAWASTVTAFKCLGGLMDFCVAGSGDSHMLNALLGDVTLFYRPGMTDAFKEAMKNWQVVSDNCIRKNIGYVNGICYHYWHGRSEQRGYEKRWDIICYHGFDPKIDIIRQGNGLYIWTGNKPELIQDLRKSMSERNEDSID